VIRRPAGLGGLRPLETELRQIQSVDEYIDHSHRVVFLYPVIQSLWKQNALRPVVPIDVSTHRRLRQPTESSDLQLREEFSHGLGRERAVRSGPLFHIAGSVRIIARDRAMLGRSVHGNGEEL